MHMRMFNISPLNHRRVLSGCAMLSILAAATFSLQVASETLLSGEYQTEGGWGYLTIDSAVDGTQTLSLESHGPNGHLCGLEGKLVGDRGIIDQNDGEGACFIRLIREGDAINVISGHESCRNYCGYRGIFEGQYYKPAPGCEVNDVQQARATFKQLYDRKQYRKALDILAPVPTRCAKTLDQMQIPNITNDIAITQYKLGLRDACLKTLEPLSKDAMRSDEDILADYPPADGIGRLESVKAARTNVRLCRGLKKK
jgi:hypothetical protein